MGKISKKNQDDIFAKEFAKLYVSVVDMSKKDIEFTKQRIKMWEQIRIDHYDFEPAKIFKKKHKEWEEKLEEYDTIISNLYGEYAMECDDFYNLIT